MHVLVVDDEPALRQILAAYAAKGGHSVDQAAGAAEARAKLGRGDVDVVLCDIKMPDGSGIELVRELRASGIDTAFVMVTAFASVETAVEALRAGAFDYIIKPVRQEELLNRLSQLEALRRLREENRALRRQARERAPLYRFRSPAMIEMERLLGKVARTNSTVLMTGESGTGKSVLARTVHELSERSDGPFLPLNCGAIPDQLVESEFFGHTKGAFTGADRARKGLVLEADGGTLFLDEISELPLPVQAKLLHVIDEKAVRAVGSEHLRNVDVRIIAATNRDLAQMVAQGGFREDLFFRLSAFQIVVPPLRERAQDLRSLVQFMIAAHSPGHRAALRIDPQAEELLVAYRWPGNIRELDNVINRACIVAEDDCITVADLPAAVVGATRAPETPSGRGALQSAYLRDRLHKVEQDILLAAIQDAGGDRRAAAQKLGISLSSLYRKLGEPDQG